MEQSIEKTHYVFGEGKTAKTIEAISEIEACKEYVKLIESVGSESDWAFNPAYVKAVEQIEFKEKFVNAKLNQISQVYKGKREHCRCGCGGNYIATSYMEKPRSSVNDKKVEKLLKEAQELILNDADFNAGKTYFDVKTGENKTLTFYFDEIKQATT